MGEKNLKDTLLDHRSVIQLIASLVFPFGSVVTILICGFTGANQLLLSILLASVSVVIALFIQIFFQQLDSNRKMEIHESNHRRFISSGVKDLNDLLGLLSKGMNEGSIKTYTQLSGETLLNNIGRSFYTSLLRKFKILEKPDGLVTLGHQLSIDIYIEMWKLLVVEQIKIYNRYKDNRAVLEKESLIYRSTHSNDPKILNRNSDQYSHKIADLQEEFTHYKGYIVRIFTGTEEQEPADVTEVINQIQNDYIDQRYLHYKSTTGNSNSRYDFAWVTNGEDGNRGYSQFDVIAVWISDNQNKGIASCEIYEERIDEYLDIWDEVGYKIEMINKIPLKIPSSRSIRVDREKQLQGFNTKEGRPKDEDNRLLLIRQLLNGKVDDNNISSFAQEVDNLLLENTKVKDWFLLDNVTNDIIKILIKFLKTKVEKNELLTKENSDLSDFAKEIYDNLNDYYK